MEPSVKLSSGYNVPLVGFGTWKSEQKLVGSAVEKALEVGYRHIDCAAIYGNEKEVGEAFAKKFSSGISREDVFITSKLWNTCHEPENVRKHCEITLKDLGLQYLDLYLIHWPVAFKYTGEKFTDDITTIPVPIRDTWLEMEKLVEAGLVRSIGVSNFNVQSLIDLLSYAKIKPAVNQVELHPFLSQPELKKFCDQHNIHLTAYSPLGNGAFVDNEIVGQVAKTYNKSIPNILCRWSVQKGFSVIPKSTTAIRVAENFNILDFTITDADMEKLDSMNKGLRTCDPAKFWNIPLFN
ncbi:hypothetical protein DICPUDRAFT_92315 [Dictyostelium purpureum]|uniref:aldose reductase n=1 Tax=Dictyostelium purpureum TaxID=5786 RepID=F0ZQ18_DICPU|nr:uncharacterized protein DICPUDRAFT_92315 [Dictyostelium purpureum]EGC33972.1 hypothetical protein DICPUDRAFT_92315 [Dictyostelium purpureum]|eukprot:XP_003289505.1 hypothetical protein DICPUDRAFT_92315 [Dictyostelium purpureum]